MASVKPGALTFWQKVSAPALMLWIFATTFFPAALAQEAAGPGWVAAESNRRPSNAISLTATRRKEMAANALPPFPVLVPKAIVYPPRAVRKKWEGQVIVAAEVLPDGSVGRTALSRSSGHEMLDEAAENSIKTWKFEYPYENNGEAPPQYVDIPVTFKLQREDRS